MLCICDHLKKEIHFPGDPIVKTPLQGAQVLFPVRELRSHRPQRTPPPKKEHTYRASRPVGGTAQGRVSESLESRASHQECACVLSKDGRHCPACWLRPCAILEADMMTLQEKFEVHIFMRHILLSFLSRQQNLSPKNATGQLKHISGPLGYIFWFRKWINSIVFRYRRHTWRRGASRVLSSISSSRGRIPSLCCWPMHSGGPAHKYITIITLF